MKKDHRDTFYQIRPNYFVARAAVRPFRSGLGPRTWHHSCAAIWRGLKSNKRGPLQPGLSQISASSFRPIHTVNADGDGDELGT